MRRAVWRRLAACFAPGTRVLEMNCGTGEDALWLARRGIQVHATDISPLMLQIARGKLATLPSAAPVSFQQLAWEDLRTLEQPPFDGMLSNFGGLNCVSELDAVVAPLARVLKPGAIAVLCLMGRYVPWEWLWFVAHGRPKTAFRRLDADGALWAGAKIYYPSVPTVCKAFAPSFAVRRVSALGALIPPPYTEQSLGRFRRLILALDWMERRCETVWPLPRLADHYLLEIERR
jgi:SAM-dependent methyltransferase